MPKIRQVKPELFTSASLPEAIEARWLFVGMWTEADDDGRLLDLPKRLAGAIFPHDDVTDADVVGWIDMLVEHGQVRRYTADGKACLLIVNFSKHQYVARKVKSRLPAPPADEADEMGSEQGTCESHVSAVQEHADSLPGSGVKGLRDQGSSSSPTDPDAFPPLLPAWAEEEVERRFAANAGRITNPRAWRAAVITDVLAGGPPSPPKLSIVSTVHPDRYAPGCGPEEAKAAAATAKAALRKGPA